MKKCICCGKEKELSEYYDHPQMGDGHLNKCKDCVREYVRKRDNERRSTPDGLIAERKRGRDKYYRLYRFKKTDPALKKKIMTDYRIKYPEKVKAKSASKDIHAPDGKEKHHWSYCEEHWRDVFFMTISDHNKIHRHMIYDQERLMYRTTDGILLDTREAHERYFNVIKTQEP